MTQLIPYSPSSGLTPAAGQIPQMFLNAGERATNRFLEFFAANIRNAGTRAAYLNAVNRFCAWSDEHGVQLNKVSPLVVATYIETLMKQLSAPSVKLHLAAIRMLFDYLVTGQIIPFNPAASVRGPRHVVRKGKTPVLAGSEAKLLLGSIETDTIIGLRDSALIGLMTYSFARVSAAIGMDIEDFYPQGCRMWFRLHEKGGKYHEVPAHRHAVDYLDAYLAATARTDRKKLPLFCTFSRKGDLTETRLHRTDALRMVKRRAIKAGLPGNICNHTFRATGITNYLENDGNLENAQLIAGHEDVRTTKLYDRTGDIISIDEIEKISL